MKKMQKHKALAHKLQKKKKKKEKKQTFGSRKYNPLQRQTKTTHYIKWDWDNILTTEETQARNRVNQMT